MRKVYVIVGNEYEGGTAWAVRTSKKKASETKKELEEQFPAVNFQIETLVLY